MRTFFPILLLLAFRVASSGQNVTLSIGSGPASAGGTIALPLNLVSRAGSEPAALQWSFHYSSDISNVAVALSTAGTSARKSASCSANKCLIFGLTKDVIRNGTVATVTLRIAPNPSSKTIPIQIVDVVASTALGASIPAGGTPGTISLR
jgi:hypothetical protein